MDQKSWPSWKKKRNPWIALEFLKWLISKEALKKGFVWQRATIELSQSQQSEMNGAPVADHAAKNQMVAFATFLLTHFLFSFFGHLLLFCVLTFIYCKKSHARLSLSLFLFSPLLCCCFFFVWFFLPKIKRHTSIYSTGNKGKSERLSRRWVFCLTNLAPPGRSFHSCRIVERYLAIFSVETPNFQQPEQK